MPIERATTRDDDDLTYVDGGGSGVAGIIIGVALVALLAIAAFFLLSARADYSQPANALTSTASSPADTTAKTDETGARLSKEASAAP